MAPAQHSTVSFRTVPARSPATIAAICCLFGLALLLPGCRQQADQPAPAPPAATAPADDAATEVEPAPRIALADVSEGDARYRVGITYPPGIDRHQGLAVELSAYAEKARADLDHALEQAAARNSGEGTFYDLILNFTLLADTPDVVVVAADGSSFLGGAHSVPLIERFVWLPGRGERLRAEALIPSAQGWQAVSDHVREQLHAELFQRVDADELDPVERARILREAGKMIDAGTAPKAESFHNFVPVMTDDGRHIAALRFVFPPYQVGPYTDASTSAEVPAAALLPHVAEDYRALFAVDAGSPQQRRDPLREALGGKGG